MQYCIKSPCEKSISLGYNLHRIIVSRECCSTWGKTNRRFVQSTNNPDFIGNVCSIFLTIPKLWELESNFSRKIMLSSVTYTGAVHIMLGLKDPIFMIGGIGIICLGFAPLVVEFAKSNEKLFQIGLCINAAIMLVGYFVSNHDLHYLLEDYLGITTKLAEITILTLVYKLRK